MNTITINSILYLLPTAPDRLHSTLNHIDMVKKGVREYVKLTDAATNATVKIGTFELSTAAIQVNINEANA